MKRVRQLCLVALTAGLLLQGACGDDGERVGAGLDGGTHALDASIDSGSSLDATTSCRLDQRYRFGSDYGRYELTPDGLIRHFDEVLDGGVATGCEVALPSCTASTDGGVTVGELSAAFLASDVVAAYSDHPTPFGSLDRNTFQSWPDVYREIVREDGKRILVGRPCSEPGCVSVPPGLSKLNSLLGRSSVLHHERTAGVCF